MATELKAREYRGPDREQMSGIYRTTHAAMSLYNHLRAFAGVKQL